MKLSIQQENAVDMCCDLSIPIACVTGGAGVGKTFVMGKVYAEFREMKKPIALCAPTGRAAKRIEELTGIKAKTVHRLLEFPMPFEDGDPTLPKRNRQNPLSDRVVIVDESSMISPLLFRQLMDALPRGSVIRWFGDNNQLPPVEEGKPPFITMLNEFPSVILTYNYRSGDALIENAQRILDGLLPRRCPQFEIIYSENPIATLLDFITPHFTQDDHQIIMPTRKGKAGTSRVNPSIQMLFNGKGPMLRLDRFDKKEAALTVRARDKFLWIKNDYKLNMFNGEIGHIDWVDADAGELGVVAGNRTVIIPPRIKTYDSYVGHIVNYDPRKQIELGYAITTHKAQGSEFDAVIYCISKSHIWLLNKRNFYTAVTRAKKQVVLITDRRAMGLSMRRYDV
jgi:exodeoxyribonuclease V alpha subunit